MMRDTVLYPLFCLLAYAALLAYGAAAYYYVCSILKPKLKKHTGLILVELTNCLALGMLLFLDFPTPACYLLLFLVVVLEFSFLFEGELVECLFGSSTFMFHIYNVRMLVSGIFVLASGSPSLSAFRGSPYYPAASFITLLVCLLFLQVFKNSLGRASMGPLLGNKGQLYFVTTSNMLINVYLLMLSVGFGVKSGSPLLALFLLATALLLFGAFYTSFQHAVKMSILLEFEARAKQLEKQLKKSYQSIDALKSEAYTDTLTAVKNRRYGLTVLEGHFQRQEAFSLAFLDIDHLKAVNDRFGHGEGDTYILHVVRALCDTLRPTDTVCRMGGDEFMVLLPGRTRETARALLEAAGRRLGQIKDQLDMPYEVGISYGAVQVDFPSGLTPADVLKMADARMYEDKQRRRAQRQ